MEVAVTCDGALAEVTMNSLIHEDNVQAAEIKFRDMTEALLAKTKLAEQKEAEEKAAEEPSAEEQTVQLLQQIRDELSKQNAARN